MRQIFYQFVKKIALIFSFLLTIDFYIDKIFCEKISHTFNE